MTDRPNILCVVIDDMGFGSTSGGPIETLAIERGPGEARWLRMPAFLFLHAVKR
jgi:hypothetical protein